MTKISQYNTPIYNYLRKYARQGMNVFHMPGHKLSGETFTNGNFSEERLPMGMPQELLTDVLQLDVTEVEGTDNLHHPEGIIKEAQELAAKAFGADHTFFLVNGSTCGIQAAILTVCARGQKLILGRDSHKAAASGLILSGAQPVFVYPEFNSGFGIPGAVSPESVEKAILSNPDAAAVLLTRPNYYGICSDIEKISEIVHRYNKLLIVDEAHGSHFAFSPELPPSAIRYGADICIQSAHKTLPALTQGSYLHVKGSRVDMERLKFNLTMLQTSSPSYIIMSYLDIARELMETRGEIMLRELTGYVEAFRFQMKGLSGYRMLSSSDMDRGESLDPTRLVIRVSDLGVSGYAAEKLLREKFRTQVEMSDLQNLVLIATVADTRENFEKLLETMQKLRELVLVKSSKILPGQICFHDIYRKLSEPEARVTPGEACAGPREKVLLGNSVGRICADIVTPYPPGVPVLYPGEIIRNDICDYIEGIIKAGGHVNGIEEGYISVGSRKPEEDSPA